MLRDSVAQFAREVISPRTQAMDEAGQMDADIIQACFEQGIMGVEVPTEHGGVGLGFTAACLAVEEIAKVDAAVAAMIDIHNTLLVRAFMEYGNEEQRDTWLPRLASDTLAAFCISEPGSGSDAFALQTRAVRDGDDWVIDGGKCWISNAMEAGVFVVFANADPSKGHKGITAFVVEKGNPGLQIGKKENKLGIRASSTCELVFEGMRVPGNAVLGEVGQGYKIAISLLNEGRIGIAAQMVGLASGAFDYAMGYMVTRTKQFGQVVADFQGMQFQYARARMEIEAARCLVYNAARLKENGKPFVMEAAMAKLKASEVAQSVTSEAIDWLGGVGFTKEFLAEKYYRDSKIGTIYEGDEPATSSLPPSRRSSGEATTDGAAPRPSAPTRLAHASARRSAVRRARSSRGPRTPPRGPDVESRPRSRTSWIWGRPQQRGPCCASSSGGFGGIRHCLRRVPIAVANTCRLHTTVAARVAIWKPGCLHSGSWCRRPVELPGRPLLLACAIWLPAPGPTVHKRARRGSSMRLFSPPKH
ncbi:unnamed protein product [Prorocentrum cordatum]|uniref:short-chain 2-methylacyl-CoA dehydrogenase n=1 Tax=Prorocentrum cordatum TaxID=2364126 RepID=A0ABN9V3I9_9DINO|nr:unnamed protein product [Polarella glacialis]